MKRQLFAAASLLLMINATAQAPWVLPGNSGTNPSADFVGTTDNEELVFRTDDLFRFRLNKSETYLTLGGFNNVPANGFALLSPNDNFINNAPGPYTGLHLAAATNNTSQQGYRSNMGNGITLTGNNDHMYVGQLFRSLDFTDAAIVWSDNPGEWLADGLTFNFTSSYNLGATSGNTSFRGLQTLLIQPAGSGQEAFVGVGDFDAASATPSERLDILNGRLRIRPLPTDPPMTSEQFMVVDNTGVVGWRNLGTLPDNCEWRLNNTTLNVFTAVSPGGTGCPGDNANVGIGIDVPTAKLHVVDDGPDGEGDDVALLVNERLGGGGVNTSVSVLNNISGPLNATGTNRGLVVDVRNAQTTLGARIWAERNLSGANGTEVTGLETRSRSSQILSGQLTGLNASAALLGTGSAPTLRAVQATSSVPTGASATTAVALFGQTVGNGATSDAFGSFTESAGGAVNTTGSYTRGIGQPGGAATGLRVIGTGNANPTGPGLTHGVHATASGASQATIYGVRTLASTNT
jgi:hypothetical protein